ncbi:MAG: c-type cytochrome [Acidobacteriota bacterium]|nr:c-type cytochrome [Acidobacteriota bacterium]
MAARHAAFAVLLMCHVFVCAGCRRETPPSSAEKALETFQLPPGFRIELAAAEPDVKDPVAMAFDERGRLFVVELSGYPLGVGNGRIKLLEDRDGNGRFETSTVFADNLQFPTGVLPWKGGVLVTAAPDVLYFADTNGDNRADTRRVVLTGFATTNPQLRVNGLLHGLDNWIYVSYPRVLQPQRYVQEFGGRGSPIHFPDHPGIPAVDALAKGTDVRFRMDPPQLEAAAGNGQFGNAFDASGNRFTVWNNDHARHVVLGERYGSANPHLAVRSAMHSISDHGNAATLFPITDQPLHVHESEIGHFTSASGIAVDAGGTFPAPFQGGLFVCDPVHNVVHADRLSSAGVTFTASRALKDREFLASTDSWFRPVFTAGGPDGALYVVDFHRKLVEHPEWLPAEMMNAHDQAAGRDRGRIYRVAFGATARDRPQATPADGLGSQLVQHLGHSNLWWRATAQRLLVERQDRSVVPGLRAMVRQNGAAQPARLHALWTLEGLAALDGETVLHALEDGDPGIREHAIRLAELHLSDGNITSRLLRMTDDPSVRVQFQLACTLGRIRGEDGAVFHALQRIAMRQVEDSWFHIAVLSGAAGTGAPWMRELTKRTDFAAVRTPGKEELLRRVASMAGSRRDTTEIEAVLADVIHARAPVAEWWQRAALDGVAAGLRHGAAEAAALSPRAQNLLFVLLETGSAARRQSALDISRAVTLRNSPELHRLLRRASRNAWLQAAPTETRVQAIGLLGLDPTGNTVATLEDLLSPQHPEPLQRAAAGALLGMRDSRATTTLLKGWRAHSGAVREIVVSGFFGSRVRIVALLDAVEAGTLQPDAVGRPRSAQLRTHPDPDIRQRARKLLGPQDGQRTDVVSRYSAALKPGGSAERGRDIFVSACSACHRLGGIGFDVGPDLGGITARDRRNLLTQILDPNASIVAGYEDYLVETADGRSITGIIAQRTDTAITLRRAAGEEETILRASIRRLRALSLSPMPEGLEAGITVQGMADLLQFLKSFPGEKR